MAEHSDPIRRRKLVIGVAATVVVVLAGVVGVFAYLWSQSGAHPVSISEAQRRFDKRRDGADSGALLYTPAEGVYEYRGQGSEHLSSPPKSQSEGPQIPGTVTHLANDCWTLRMDYSSNHWREWTFCVHDEQLTEVSNRVFQRWDFVVNSIDNLAEMTCDPPSLILGPDMRVGEGFPATCSGTNTAISGTTTSSGTHRLVNTEARRVGGVAVDTFHFHDDRVVSGGQTGTERFDFWLTDRGLLVKGTQRIQVDSDSPIGDVTYTQESAFVLVSLVPRG